MAGQILKLIFRNNLNEKLCFCIRFVNPLFNTSIFLVPLRNKIQVFIDL